MAQFTIRVSPPLDTPGPSTALLVDMVREILEDVCHCTVDVLMVHGPHVPTPLSPVQATPR